MELHTMKLKQCLAFWENALKENPECGEMIVGMYVWKGPGGPENSNLIMCMAPLPNAVQAMLAAAEKGIEPMIGIGEVECDANGKPATVHIEKALHLGEPINHPKNPPTPPKAESPKAKPGEDKAGPQGMFDLSKLGAGLNWMPAPKGPKAERNGHTHHIKPASPQKKEEDEKAGGEKEGGEKGSQE